MRGGDGFKDGFYACMRWPYWFQLCTHPISGQIIVGFSIWKNVPGYRTATFTFAEWLSQDDNADVEIHADRDRTDDPGFVLDYRRFMRARQRGEL